MVGRRKTGQASSYGARYGRTVRKKLVEIEIEKRKSHICPSCGSKKVKRISVGIWTCGKCALSFSGGAYTPYTKIGEDAKRSIKSGLTSATTPG